MATADQPHQQDPRAGRPDRAEQVRDQDPQRLGLAAAAPAPRFFRFTQIEVPWALGPPDGRYLLREPGEGPDSQPSHVLVLATLGAPERRRLRRRRARKVEAGREPEPSPVSTERATVIDVRRPLADADEAAGWLARAGEQELDDDLAVLNRALHSFRVAAADPYLAPVGRHQALVARIGYGLGEEVADGLWTEARILIASARRQRRSKVLAPQARLAALLGGRERVLASEELALRARLDLDQGRDREAALQLMVAFDAAIAELVGELAAPLLSGRREELREQRDPVARAAQSALEDSLGAEDHELLEQALGRVEAALRARAAAKR